MEARLHLKNRRRNFALVLLLSFRHVEHGSAWTAALHRRSFFSDRDAVVREVASSAEVAHSAGAESDEANEQQEAAKLAALAGISAAPPRSASAFDAAERLSTAPGFSRGAWRCHKQHSDGERSPRAPKEHRHAGPQSSV